MNDSEAVDLRRALTIFEQVCDLTGPQRDEVLQRCCGDDAELRAHVDRLLAADAATDSPLDHSPAGQWLPRIPGYRVGEEIGRGGMGAVYAAQREDADFHQRLAIKLLRNPLADPQAIRRFQRERAILARLDHPNIARLIDGGATAAGQAFLVMERIEGRTLLAYCDAERIDLDGRLDLFKQVCAAVQHAHRHLVVHRDIKPANVLVNAEGQVKLLDFGIAGLLDEEHAVAESTRAMTPEFASPEQVRGEPVTTASDVYALGVLLYRLLSGTAPYDLAGLTPAAIEAVVCDAPVPPPGRRCADRSRARRLRGDLDTIVMKAMHRTAERRYGSAAQLAEDIERYQQQLPIAARADRLGYRFARLMQRHRLASTLAAALLLALVGFAAIMTWQVRQTRLALAQATQERTAAGQVVEFLVGLFELADPTGRRLESITVRELLDRGAEQAIRSAPDAPHQRARLLTAMARVYANLGDYTRSSSLIDQLEPGLLDAAEQAQAGSVRALALRGLGDVQGARAAITDAIELATGKLGPTAPATLAYRYQQATIERDAGQYELALRALTELLPQQEEALGPDHPAVASTRMQLGAAHWLTGDLDTADGFYRSALQIQRHVLPAGHPELASTLSGLSILAQRRGDYPRAIELGREALAIRRLVYGDLHPYVASALSNLGAVHLDAGDPTSARARLVEAWEIQQDIHKQPEPSVANTANNLGLLELRSNDPAAAVPWFRQAIAIGEAVHGRRHPSLASYIDNLGLALLRQGELIEAERLIRESLKQREALLGSDHVHTAWSLHHLGETLAALGDPEQAGIAYRRALDIREAGLGADHELSIASRAALVDLCESEPPACAKPAGGSE